MSIWIKICGNTSLVDARMAVEAGADAVGFVFAPSPRRVSPVEAASIISHLPPVVEKIGVFVDAHVEEIYSTVRISGLTGVQLHFDADAALAARLHGQLGPQLRVLQVVHFDPDGTELVTKQVAEHARNLHVDAVLVDSRTAIAVGGTGMAFNWGEARKTVFADIGTLKLIAAGGLNPANVAEAIATLQPWGVDVVSGVEAEPGRKDRIKVHEFVANARAVARK